MVQAANHKKENAKYAVKVVENDSLGDEENLEALETEINILRKLRNPHIVQLKEVVTTAANTYIVMELLSGGELFNRIVEKGCYPEAEAQDLFAQARGRHSSARPLAQVPARAREAVAPPTRPVRRSCSRLTISTLSTLCTET